MEISRCRQQEEGAALREESVEGRQMAVREEMARVETEVQVSAAATMGVEVGIEPAQAS